MSEDNRIAIRRALVSVYDKTGLLELGQSLVDAGVEIVSTGSTAGRLSAAGLPVTPVEALTGFPECLDGRVKTLHPRVHAGVLADLRNPDHERQLAELEIEPFQLVVVNLYPFTETVQSGASAQECVEQIDIGGPSMVRAAAKNHANVAVVVSPAGYADVVDALEGGFTLDQRRTLAGQAFQHTASYDVAVASWFGNVLAPTDAIDGKPSGFPSWIGATYERAEVLRYGENPHQRAALYVSEGIDGLAQADQLHGKAMSYNNYLDTNAALRAAYDFETPTVAIIKHANPCGIATAATVELAHQLANACDPASAFGGVIAVNREVTVAMARQVGEIFTEVIVAPSYEAGAVEILSAKPSIRVLLTQARGGTDPEFRQICGGLLLQSADTISEDGDTADGWSLVTGAPADADTLADLEFAWRACRAVKSNAILLASGLATVGIGMGQVSRVDSCKLAVMRAGDRAAGSVAASDAYFPFPDGAEVLLEAGVKAIVEPGGSVRDPLVIEACAKAGVTLYFTGVRHFFH